ncbi:ribonuclease HI family protein [Ligilactobacillus apodemi]|uniref:Ribonuclease HI cell wall enzyme EBSB n=1 Tax=Ligilactobacillus apodemi DSM 16634 = JCM 16172 TaxID=1423724 RepID=A0A0R1TR18_9LACO|nr:ribonuclease HI family protein [Ligilactobacillus apodemi]KRL83905.1 ribonuclease HI cell wall enzyme EBSB [Ligilactobacillus apodemi DSM 16634 = JCM 16172]MCR1900758.1 ribonuclease HI family protein [Ligilactobacillus apodemi]
MVKLYTDAATKKDNSATGILLVTATQQFQLKQKITASNNHQAEFKAAILGFEYLLEHFPETENVFFYSDSKIVIDSLTKKYSKSFAKELAQLLELQQNFPLVINQWIADSQNKGAHTLALQALND